MRLGVLIATLAVIAGFAMPSGTAGHSFGTVTCEALAPVTQTCTGEVYLPEGTGTFNATAPGPIVGTWTDLTVNIHATTGFNVYTGQWEYDTTLAPVYTCTAVNGVNSFSFCDVTFLGGAGPFLVNATITGGQGLWGWEWTWPCNPTFMC